MKEFKVVIELKNEPTIAFTLRTYSEDSALEIAADYKAQYPNHKSVKVVLTR
jgi:hypothetical protein